MTETHLLLQEFKERRSEAAFRELVARYLDLVYSTALRRTRAPVVRSQRLDCSKTVAFIRSVLEVQE